MAKGKYRKWLEPDGLILLEGWARDGLTDEQIAKNMGIATGTIYEYKNKYPEIQEALRRGKDVADYEVENALYRTALNGNVTAQIFWLKNRRADRWRNALRMEAKVEANVAVADMSLEDKLRLVQGMRDGSEQA